MTEQEEIEKLKEDLKEQLEDEEYIKLIGYTPSTLKDLRNLKSLFDCVKPIEAKKE